MHKSRGFTLIELLIVVAIIAILAAIAIPNFIEAQVRSKVSRARADMRSIATAIEAYRVDSPNYPPDQYIWTAYGVQGNLPPGFVPGKSLMLHVITTPVSYMSSVPDDPFENRTRSMAAGSRVDADIFRWYSYVSKNWANLQGNDPTTNKPKVRRYEWVLVSEGPDNHMSGGSHMIFHEKWLDDGHTATQVGWRSIYDATNGSKSEGDIVRAGP